METSVTNSLSSSATSSLQGRCTST